MLSPRDAIAVSGRTALQVNLLNYRHDGTPFVNHLHIAPIRNSAGEVRPVMCAAPTAGSAGAVQAHLLFFAPAEGVAA